MLTFLVDSGCLIAVQTPGEPFHAVAAQVIEAGAAGLVHLMTATSVEYDLEGGTRSARRISPGMACPTSLYSPGAGTLHLGHLAS